jgi:branched-chain amino acid transport system substrate-binding protein
LLSSHRVRGAIVAFVVLATGIVGIASSSASTSSAVRGFDGSTITVAGMGIKAQFPGAEVGAKARIQRFNDDNEVKGIKINYAEFADVEQDTAKSLSEARRLVTQVGVFGIVGDEASTNPGEYFAQQHVPYFGWAFDTTYCSSNPTTKLWGFGFYGCVVTNNPNYVNGWGSDVFKLASQETGKKHPTLAVNSNDNQSGKHTVAEYAAAYKLRGFDVVFQKADVPEQVSDFTPYSQELLTADGGKAPDVIVCGMGFQCLTLWQTLQASGYKGIYWSGLYSAGLAKALNGSYVGIASHNLSESNPNMDQMKADIEKVSPGFKVDTGAVGAYTSTDMFIQIIKKLAAKGTSSITPENVQKMASTMKWEMKGVAGPTIYPKSTVWSFPYCQSLLKSNGTTFETVEDYTCYTTWTKHP